MASRPRDAIAGNPVFLQALQYICPVVGAVAADDPRCKVVVGPTQPRTVRHDKLSMCHDLNDPINITNVNLLVLTT